MTKLRLLFVSNLYGNTSAGSVLCWKTLIHELRLRGHRCIIVTDKHQTLVPDPDSVLISESEIKNTLRQLIEQHNPHAVLMQHDWTFPTAFFLKNIHVPLVYFVRLQNDWNNNILREYPFDVVITHSRYSHALLKQDYRKKSVIFPSFIRLENAKKTVKRKYITIINPLQIKGGGIFLTIAQRLKSEQFLAVSGWNTISPGSFKTHPVAFYDMLDFSHASNVEFTDSTLNMREIYDRTRILLLPSLFPETFSRVAYEALAYNVPTIIANRIGALPEVLGDYGRYIENPDNIQLWINAIKNSSKTNNGSADSKRETHLLPYRLDTAVSRFEQLLVTTFITNKTLHGKANKYLQALYYKTKRILYYRL